jgi:hypothetical protein
MSRVYPTSIRLTSHTLNPSLAGVSQYYYADQLKQHLAYSACIERLGFVYGLKRLTLKKGTPANIQPAVFPIIAKLRARSYLNLQLANSQHWFVNKLLPGAGLWQQCSSALSALRSLCQETNGFASWEQKLKLELTFLQFGLVLLAHKTKSAKHLAPVPAPIAKLQLKNKAKRVFYDFQFLSQSDQSVNLHQINLICRDLIKATPDQWILECVSKPSSNQEKQIPSLLLSKREKGEDTNFLVPSKKVDVVFSAVHRSTLKTPPFSYGLDISQANQPAYCALKPISTYLFRFHRPNKLNLFINLTSRLPKGIKQTNVYTKDHAFPLFPCFSRGRERGFGRETTGFNKTGGWFGKKTPTLQGKTLYAMIPKSKAVTRCFKTLKLMPFLPRTGGAAVMDCVNQSISVQRLKSVARFALTLGPPNTKSLRQTLSIRL